MADLTDNQAAQSVKIIGASTSGVESNPLAVDAFQSAQIYIKDSLGNSITSDNYGTERSLTVTTGDGPELDGYGRHRVSSQDVQYSLYFSTGAHPLLINTALTGAGTSAFNSTIGSLRLTNTTSAADSVIVQSKRYIQYNPGASYNITLSGVIGAKKSNVRQRWGYFDTNDGIFFEQTATDLAVVLRTSTSGAPVDTRILQANWNLDKLDGTGISGVTLDTSKHNLYCIDYVWQGAGRVRFGVMVGGSIVYCHQILNSNINTAAYFKNPSKPIRVELTNTGTAASGTTLDVICFSATREAITDIFAPYTFTTSRGITTKSINSTTPLPLISIRPALTFNGLTNRVPILPSGIEAFTVQDSIYVQVLLNPVLTGASWSAVSSNSATEKDTSATVATGGTILFETFIPGGGKGLSSTIDISDFIVLGLDIAGSTQDVLTITAAKINGNSDTTAKIQFEEFQ